MKTTKQIRQRIRAIEFLKDKDLEFYKNMPEYKQIEKNYNNQIKHLTWVLN